MNCKEVQELLHDYITDMLDEEMQHKVKKHLDTCNNCSDEYENIKAAVFLLDKYEFPEVAPDFEQQVLKKIETRVEQKKAWITKIKELLDKLFKPYPIKLPLEGLAVVIGVFCVIWIYNIHTAKQSYNIKNFPQKIQIEVNEVKYPIVIESEDTDKTFEELQNNVDKHNGSVLRRDCLNKECDFIKVVVSMEKTEEESFIKDLINELGKLYNIEKDAYKDKEGMIVILITKKNQP